jgi:hypothetical protein
VLLCSFDYSARFVIIVEEELKWWASNKLLNSDITSKALVEAVALPVLQSRGSSVLVSTSYDLLFNAFACWRALSLKLSESSLKAIIIQY